MTPLTNVTDVSVLDGLISWKSTNATSQVKLQNVIFVLDQSQASASSDVKPGYIISALVEDSEKSPEERFQLLLLQTSAVPDALLQRFRISGLPDYLRPVTGAQDVDVIVSTKSGVGLSQLFWQTVLYPLWSAVDELSSKEVNVLITQDEHSVRDFAQSLASSASKRKRTIILLSGDGGIVDIINGGPHNGQQQPLLAVLPLGTGNALFNSLHKPLWMSEDVSSIVVGLRTLFNGVSANLPLFHASFSPGSRIVKFKPATTKEADADVALHLAKEEIQVSHLYGAVVASYGFHSSLIYESDTPEYRVHGDKRFGMVAGELLRESHPYIAQVDVRHPASSEWETIPRDEHTYVLVTPLSNLERTFAISPASKPIDGKLRLVHFGNIGGERTMDAMMKAYDGGKHVGLKWDDGHEVRYEEVEEVRVTILEEDERWHKVCIDGTIVDIPRGGQLSVRREEDSGFQILVDSRVLSA
ncbi:ATP-NAD kinase-like domain-containing protein [Trichoderma austrokoningii]